MESPHDERGLRAANAASLPERSPAARKKTPGPPTSTSTAAPSASSSDPRAASLAAGAAPPASPPGSKAASPSPGTSGERGLLSPLRARPRARLLPRSPGPRLWDAFPASDGHPFLVTKRHVPSSNSVPDGGALSSQDIRHRPEKISTFALDKICRAFLDEAQMRSRMPLRFVQIAYETTIPSIEAQKPSRPKFVEHRPSQGASEPQCYKRVYTTNEPAGWVGASIRRRSSLE